MSSLPRKLHSRLVARDRKKRARPCGRLVENNELIRAILYYWQRNTLFSGIRGSLAARDREKRARQWASGGK